MLDDYKHDDRIYEIFKKKSSRLFANLSMIYLFVCLNKNNDEYGGIDLTFSTIFNSDIRRGLKENNDQDRILMKETNLAVGCSSSSCSTVGSLFKLSPSISSSV
jgi:hypothetical protein